MNQYETVVAANYQIGLLIENSTPEEVVMLEKHIRPIPLRVKHRRISEPQRLGDILVDVMADILQRSGEVRV